VRDGKELLPLAVPVNILIGDKVATNMRSGWLADEPHSRLLGCASCLTIVARDAGTDHILPDVSSSLITWDHMIQSKLLSVPAAILTSVFITAEHLMAS
jgi:hypothetical protein